MSTNPAPSPMPPGARRLLRELNDWAEREIATNPAFAEAIRRAEAERAAQEAQR